MRPGIYADITNADYHSGPGVSNSMLKLLRGKTPCHLKAERDARAAAANDNKPDTKAFFMGRELHSLVLEPELFVKDYCLAFRQQDMPEAIDDRETLVKMIEEINAERVAAHPDAVRDTEVLVAKITELNATRLAKLSTGGSKPDQIERIIAAEAEMAAASPEEFPVINDRAYFESLKAADLKAYLEELNKHRAGLLSTSGSRADLANLLRANGVEVVLWSEILEAHQAETGQPYIGSTSGSRHEMAAWLNANGRNVTLWSDVKAEWEKHNGHRRILTPEQWEQLHRMRDAIMAHPAACALLTGCKFITEHSAYARDPKTGVLRRVRPDLWRFDGIVGDLKTTEDASPEGFARSIAKFGYDVQHPYYLDTLNLALEQQSKPTCDHPQSAKQFVFIVVEKSPPYAVAVYVLDQASVDVGRTKSQEDLAVFAECESTGVWPGYGDLVQTISLPDWYLRKFSEAAA